MFRNNPSPKNCSGGGHVPASVQIQIWETSHSSSPWSGGRAGASLSFRFPIGLKTVADRWERGGEQFNKTKQLHYAGGQKKLVSASGAVMVRNKWGELLYRG